MYNRSRRHSSHRDQDSPSSSGSNSESGIPYAEANEDIGEIPLDKIDTFVIPSRDDKGGFSRISLPMPPYMLRNIQILLKSNRFPYLEVSDFVRHAIYRHTGFCVRIRQSIPKSIIPGLEAIMEVCRDNEYRIRVHEAFLEIDKQVSICMQRGEIGEAVRLINIIKSRLDGIPPSPALLEIMTRLQEKYQYVLGSEGLVHESEVEKKKKK